jgi:hypothetical protein
VSPSPASGDVVFFITRWPEFGQQTTDDLYSIDSLGEQIAFWTFDKLFYPSSGTFSAIEG